jgi:uncharacterized C2H2 Zn-finger protein
MALARKASGSGTVAQTSSDEGTLTCPECGRAFTRAASLGAHRSRTHGVRGASSRRTRRAGSAGNGGATRGRGGASAQPSQPPASRRRTRGASSSGKAADVDRDRLLQTLFPNGLPAREEVIRRANAWLDDAEQLAKMK